LVVFISLLVVRPMNFGRAGNCVLQLLVPHNTILLILGILAIFATQSNDFAIGYPIVQALYMKYHPEYASYIYLMAPISLAILNPIGYVLMEITNIQKKNKEQRDDAESPSMLARCTHQPSTSNEQTERKKILPGKCLVLIKTIKSIFFNPILLMTLLGVLGGVVFPQGLPIFLTSILKVLGNSFAGTALFLLGVRMVGKQTEKIQLLFPGVLIIVKL